MVRLFLCVLSVIVLASCGKFRELVPAQWKGFKDLTEIEKAAIQYDSVYGSQCKWVGINEDSVLWKLCVDENKFAVKDRVLFDKEGFFTRMPGDIVYSGHSVKKGRYLELKFYFPPESWSFLFDSLKNLSSVRIVDFQTVQLDYNADTIWIRGAPCTKAMTK